MSRRALTSCRAAALRQGNASSSAQFTAPNRARLRWAQPAEEVCHVPYNTTPQATGPASADHA
jgi:hypothetical protein